MTTLDFEAVAEELLEIFEIETPPVPIESMLQNPKPGMWREMDMTKLSGGFLRIDERFSPRMSLARLLARHLCRSEWGAEHGMSAIADDEEQIALFTRVLMMPAFMVREMNSSARIPVTMSVRFEAPESEVEKRLAELDL